MTDSPVQLRLVSPTIISKDWDGAVFADLEASFAEPSLRYHCVGRFMFSRDDLSSIVRLAERSQQVGPRMPLLRIKTVEKMKVFDLMTKHLVNKPNTRNTGDRDQTDDDSGVRTFHRTKSIKQKLDRHNDNKLKYEDIAMPEVEVEVFFDNDEASALRAKMKLKRVMRFQHLSRDFVDEADYPPTQEYFLYADQQVV